MRSRLGVAIVASLIATAPAAADPRVTEYVGGVASGFSAGTGPVGITAGPDGNLWVAAEHGPGYIEKVTPAGQFTEFTGGVTPGFTANIGPERIVTGPDGNLWFVQYKSPGAVARITPSGTVNEFTSGFSANGDEE